MSDSGGRWEPKSESGADPTLYLPAPDLSSGPVLMPPPGGGPSAARIAIVAVVLTLVVVGGVAAAYVAGRSGSGTNNATETTVLGPTSMVATTTTTATTATTAATTVAPTAATTVPPSTAVPTTPAVVGDVLAQPAGLFCRDLATRGYSYSAAVDYWRHYGQPNQMDEDRNGIPCETVYPQSDVTAYWPAATYEDTAAYGLPTGLLCRDLQERGIDVYSALLYYIWEGQPARMDADGNGVPCETVYPDAAAVWAAAGG